MAESSFNWVLASAGVYGVLHSLLASHTTKGWAEAVFGLQAQRFYRLAYVLLAIITTPALLLLVVLLPDRPFYTIPFPWVILTLLAQGGAAMGLLASVSQTGAAHFLGLQQMRQPQPLLSRSTPQQLVTRGLYRYVRHPIYTFSFILLWLFPIVTWNVLALMIGLTVYTFIGTICEERKLRAEFGDAYEMYRRQTPMLIPDFRRR